MSGKPIPVSVIIPCYRCSETIDRAIASVIAQTVQPAEVFLIDDASGDGTLDVLYALESSHPGWVTVIAQEKNGGPGLARNAGWVAATQPWLAFLDADDVWHPNKLEIQWQWLTEHPKVALCGHKTAYTQAEIDIKLESTWKARRLTIFNMIVSNQLPTRTVMIKRDLSVRFPNKKHAEDYFVWLNVIAGESLAYKLECTLAYSFRPDFSPGGLSGQLWAHEKSELHGFYILWLQKKISLPMLSFALNWSLLKFLRRLWIRWGS